MVSCAADALFVILEHADYSATPSMVGLPVTPPAGWRLAGGVHRSFSMSRTRCLLGPEATVCAALTSSRFHPAAATSDLVSSGRASITRTRTSAANRALEVYLA